ncbi:hypothetical protein ZHAS_00001291 [Anopheles sinensis]|uniref:Uncharacterized protein n=1 Tax=Anopheles sinensis TaxID=74873 RepID=A0A084VB66_ANOSI|nr:hypothetical protein ZHAS_00001291 [Anopheles sinensis]
MERDKRGVCPCKEGDCAVVEECEAFWKIKVKERWDFIAKNKLCKCCLKYHPTACKTVPCGKGGCNAKHHRSLHTPCVVPKRWDSGQIGNDTIDRRTYLKLVCRKTEQKSIELSVEVSSAVTKDNMSAPVAIRPSVEITTLIGSSCAPSTRPVQPVEAVDSVARETRPGWMECGDFSQQSGQFQQLGLSPISFARRDNAEICMDGALQDVPTLESPAFTNSQFRFSCEQREKEILYNLTGRDGYVLGPEQTLQNNKSTNNCFSTVIESNIPASRKVRVSFADAASMYAVSLNTTIPTTSSPSTEDISSKRWVARKCTIGSTSSTHC